MFPELWLGASQSFNCSRWLLEGRVGIYTVPACMENIPNPLDHPEGRKEVGTSCHARAWGRVCPAPQACGDGGGSPDPQGVAELQAGCPHMQGGLFSHSLMNQAEEICFRSTISASNLSWPGWKESFLQWRLLKKYYFQLCPRNRISMFYKYVTLLARNIHSHGRDK